MHEIIIFTYRDWTVQVTPDSNGWLAESRCPNSEEFQMVSCGCISAVDAVADAMNFVNYAKTTKLLRSPLEELHSSKVLEGSEFAELLMSPNRYWRSHLNGSVRRVRL